MRIKTSVPARFSHVPLGNLLAAIIPQRRTNGNKAQKNIGLILRRRGPGSSRTAPYSKDRERKKARPLLLLAKGLIPAPALRHPALIALEGVPLVSVPPVHPTG